MDAQPSTHCSPVNATAAMSTTTWMAIADASTARRSGIAWPIGFGMASRAWTAIERAVARLTGGERTWGDPTRIDVITVGDDTWAVETKNYKAPTIAMCEAWLAYNQIKADKRGMKSALVVKRKGGRGKPTPYLAIFQLTEPEPDRE